MFSSIKYTSSSLMSLRRIGGVSGSGGGGMGLTLRRNGVFFSTSSAPAVEINVPPINVQQLKNDKSSFSMTPKEVVHFLDEYIIGQPDAKRAVAVAFRNRWRRQRLPLDIKNEV
jgi:hypothetical protein